METTTTAWRRVADVRCNVCGAAGVRGWIRHNNDTLRWMRRCEDCYAKELDAGRKDPATQPENQRLPEAVLTEKLAEWVGEAHVVPADAPLTEAQLAELAERVAKRAAEFYLQLVPGMVTHLVQTSMPERLITVGARPAVHVAQAHKALEDVLTAVTAGVNPFLVGPAGSGKTTLAEQVAKVLERKFYMASRVTSEYKLVGFTDAQGRVVRTQFREAYEHGGVFLLDEVDASDPDVLTAFNAALANGLADFPDGMVRKHADFVAIAAGNTYGRGADRQYVGRNQLDAATLDRFTVFEVDYDEALELMLAGNDEWTRWVQRVRRAVEAEKVRCVVSPRASIYGARLLAAGMERRKVEEATVWKGLPADARSRVEYRMAQGG